MNKKLFPWFLIGVFLAAIGLFQAASAQSGNLSGLIVDFGSGQPTTYCLYTGQPGLSGYDLLLQTGLPVAALHTSQGTAVCKIGNTGCPENDCFCDSPPDYWSYWHYQDGQWMYAAEGSSNYQVQPGSLDAWVWGNGTPPAESSFEQICTDLGNRQDPASVNAGQAQPSISVPSGKTSNYLIFGILASILGIGLVFMALKR